MEPGSVEDGIEQGFEATQGAQRETKSFHRMPAVERALSDVKSGDGRVSVMGKVIEVQEDNAEAKISDGTGQSLLLFTDLNELNKVQLNNFVRVIGKPMATDKGRVIQVEVVQDFAGFDTNLYKNILDLENKYFK